MKLLSVNKGFFLGVLISLFFFTAVIISDFNNSQICIVHPLICREELGLPFTFYEKSWFVHQANNTVKEVNLLYFNFLIDALIILFFSSILGWICNVSWAKIEPQEMK
ncbi:MAG TPA: hypothetical protein VGD05_13470 [Pyrinomonadaceae bacterium]|jgi:hypothetical protein